MLLYGVNAGTLASYADMQRYVALVKRWHDAPVSDGWRRPPYPHEDEIRGAGPFTGQPRFQKQAGPPGKDFSPWTGAGFSEQQEAAFRRGFLEVVEAVADGFAADTWQYAKYTLQTIGEDIYDTHKALRYQAGTMTAKEGEQAMNETIKTLADYAAYWNSPEMLALGEIEPDAPDAPEAAPRDSTVPADLAGRFVGLAGRLVGADTLLSTPVPPADPMLEGVFDLGDKVALLGSSKSRKSFYFIQLALCLATGRDFLGLRVPHRRRVLFVNLELKDAHFHRRLVRMARGLGILASELHGQFFVFNARGLAMRTGEMLGLLHGMCSGNRTEIVFLDPLYKLAEGDENSAKDMKPVLAGFDRLATETGAAVAYSHHDAKGSPGDRDIRDRGAGSNVIGRDYDAAVTLTPHRFEVGAVVVEFLCRNYKSPDRLAVRFDEEFCIFRPATDLVPEGVTSKPPREQQNGEKWREHFEAAVTLALEQAWLKGEFTAALAKRFDLPGVQVEKLYRAVRDDERIYTDKGPNKGVTPRHFIGPEAAVTQRIKALKTQGDLGNGK